MADKKMKREIELCGRRLNYTMASGGRRRNLRVTIKPGGILAVAKPNFISDRAAEDFLLRKAAWILKTIDKMSCRRNFLNNGNRADYERLAPAARQLAAQRLAFFNASYNLKFGRVAIRDQRTRWGSCSHKGNLNFNYRIALLPPHLSDYIIVHELCHLRHLDHSRRFWDLVGQVLPDYAALRRELRSDY